MRVPALLAVLCGMRRGEIAALRWGCVDLDKGRLAVVQSAEQTKVGVRYKEPKSGQVRTVALSAAVVSELRAHRTSQAENLLKLGIRLDADGFVVAQADGSPYDPDSKARSGDCGLSRPPSPASAFTVSDILTRARCSPPAFTPKLPRNGLVTAASASRLTSIVT